MSPLKMPTLCQKEPLEACFSSPSRQSKKQKLSGVYLKQNSEQLNDVNAVAGVDLKANVCLICGDKGYLEALVYCNNCQVHAQHRYCLDKSTVTFVEDVIWICEDCAPKVAKQSTFDNFSPHPCGINESIGLEKLNGNASLQLVEAQFCGNFEKDQNCGKECRRHSCSAGEMRVHVCDGSTSVQHEELYRVSFEKDQNCGKECGSVQETKEGRGTGSVGETKVHVNVHFDEKKGFENFEKDHKFGECGPLLRDGFNSHEVNEFKILQVYEPSSVVALKSYAEAQPVFDPIWRGCLSFCKQKFDTVGGIVAHLSSLACAKVREEARLFPEVLCADLINRSTVWPKSFKKYGPTDQDIALYIFPHIQRDENLFDKLVDDIISLDLAIRAVVENAEFLVFSSSSLPLEHRRLQGKLYLWGVFRAKQASQITGNAAAKVDQDLP
ncbi:Zinc finger, FYVE/PHD-type [Quillaja saponaria]|uniref:Zinc finger, FYVE/PHD-type n=1 Tax=Quillaja saponaria TaxID=32244 RepID=A0AAD7M4W5_QUISA|nr:Zinc finger, FYVE/PHD-type [Quillaja saponaria]KAJ7969843.1 Zinc finger, FYVE/PHD-type [Quillaja saponaria]